MATLCPAPFRSLVTRLYREPLLQDAVFELPRTQWFLPDPQAPDTSVVFHGQPAGNPLGPASGPHTQMAQNLLLSYAAGARIMELKTVQVDDRLNIPRPCIDMTNIGYNVEWSQELQVDESLREYVAGIMLIHMFRDQYGPRDSTGDVVYDISLGYDLKGIRSEKVQHFVDGMRDAGSIVARLRDEIPGQFARARDLQFTSELSHSVTLSTFHGCPADEIERMCELLIGEKDLDVIVKMNPPMLGKERLEALLHDQLGYVSLKVNPQAYTSGLTFDEGVDMARRLTGFAGQRDRRFGLKFTNTLEVFNHREFFLPENKLMYLSGQPLFVIAMALVERFRKAVGPQVPISFSAGIDHINFPLAVACGFCPVTTCTDLLRPGGYGRLSRYLRRLSEDMAAHQAKTIDEFLLKRFDHQAEAQRLAAEQPDISPGAWAGWLNTVAVAEITRTDQRYRSENNDRIPKRIDSRLETFDCITCDKCLPVCPNAANFVYPTPEADFAYHDLNVDAQGKVHPGEQKWFRIEQKRQIACYADFCNECGNCDTFCPEYGGPYIKKPSFFGTLDSWHQAAPRDGFIVGSTGRQPWIRGRIKGVEYDLSYDDQAEQNRFCDGVVTAMFCTSEHLPESVSVLVPLDKPHRIDMGIYHTLRHLRAGIVDRRRINQLNASAFEL